ncbi:PdaC/SigV domain-containing protein [Cohnella silvisoli]|uniref:DUF4163 domain-containing protein n=1 Tax=Cohnella silvisoli TaxID=2873699 RepID=A0ABV1KMX2_9BACL|nr:DUF4163 domain-containing protein [Cohnella silvisoli]MCD9020379.1 DUF4163 domain-containing protein [Cohnella silvisoli]
MKQAGLKQGKRGLIAFVVAATLMSTPLILPAQQANAATVNPYKNINQPVSIEGVRVDLSALNTDNTTYIAVRSLNESIGLNTKFDKIKQTVTVTGRGRVLVLDLKSGGATLNGQTIYGLPAIVQNYTTYVPFRFLLERMGYGVSYDTASKAIGIEAIQENDLKITNAVIKEESAKKSLLVNYPQISGFADEAVQNKINALLKSEAELNADAARESLSEALGEIPDHVPAVAFDGTYTITYNEQGKLSLYVDYYIYTGGAHGSTARVPYTFDLKTGNLLTLKDATGNHDKYVSIINSKIKSQIKARGIYLLNPFETIEPDRDYFLKHNGLVIFFGQYEYTPYAEGMPEFEIPFSDFK